MDWKRKANICPYTNPVKHMWSQLSPYTYTIKQNTSHFTSRSLSLGLFSFLVLKLPCIPNYHYLGGLCRVNKTGLVSEALSS